jgi:hypothetical protein
MPVEPVDQRLVAVGQELPDPEVDANEDGDSVTKCGHCGRSFPHPSIGLGDPPKWWVCPSCRNQSLGDEARADARWARDAWP